MIDLAARAWYLVLRGPVPRRPAAAVGFGGMRARVVQPPCRVLPLPR